MPWGLTRSSDAATEPITLSEAKLHMRVSHSDEDSLIDGLIVGARQWVEHYTGRSLLDQTWRLTLDAFPGGGMVSPPVTEHTAIHHYDGGAGHNLWLPRPPLQSVTSIDYTRQDGTSGTVDSSVYVVDTDHVPGRVALVDGESWPSDDLQAIGGVTVTYQAGYGSDADDVPRPLRHAVMMLVGHLYEHRETVTVGGGGNDVEMPLATRALAWPYRVFPVGPVR